MEQKNVISLEVRNLELGKLWIGDLVGSLLFSPSVTPLTLSLLGGYVSLFLPMNRAISANFSHKHIFHRLGT